MFYVRAYRKYSTGTPMKHAEVAVVTENLN